FETAALALQRGHTFHLHAAQETLSVPVIEFLNHSVAPRLTDGNEPGLDTVQQAQTNQRSHGTRIAPAAVKYHLVIDLLISRQTESQPRRPERRNSALRISTKQRFNCTSACAQLYTIEAVEAQRRL